MGILQAIGTDLSALLEGIDSEVVAFFKGAMAAVQAAGGAPFVQAVTDVVVAESKTGATGAQKASSALTSLKNDLGGVAESALNMGIEAAVQNLPGYGAATVTAAPTPAPGAVTEATVDQSAQIAALQAQLVALQATASPAQDATLPGVPVISQ